MAVIYNETEYRRIGKVLKPQGVRGEFVLYLESDFPEWLAERKVFYARKGDTLSPWRVKSARFHQDKLILRVDALADRTAVEAARDTELYLGEEEARSANQDPDYFFNSDLIGMTLVESDTHTDLGEVLDVVEMPGHSLIEVRHPAGEAYLVPFTAGLIDEVDLEAGQIRATLPEGLVPGTEADSAE